MVAQGEVKGDVYASEQAVLKKPCHHTGNIHAPRISIESGAILMGGVEMEAQNIEHAFETLSGCAITQDQSSSNSKNNEQSVADANRQQAMPAGSKDWPIFYPRS
jgi:cytoskeletal protein CcmA (bactofilin family)